MPPIVSVAAAVLVTAQEAPVNGTVTVWLLTETVPIEQLEKPEPSVTAGEAGTMKAGSNWATTLDPPTRAPDELVVKPTAQLAVAPSVWGVPANVTFEGAVAALIVTLV